MKERSPNQPGGLDDPRFIAFLYHFNVRQDYCECHECGEQLWLEHGRPSVWKGLIQTAVSMYHVRNGNVRGGWRMWQRAREYLRPYRPVYMGIDVDQLTADVDTWFERLPDAWRGAQVSPEDVDRLDLPAVQIRILDVDVARRVEALSEAGPASP
ncbi:MAG: DUF309 domain-containing protein [Alicyclobacillaceae bacterium]|nr:DUF309 domain-containing protein [Alicyclobacillaceae bacterium]